MITQGRTVAAMVLGLAIGYVSGVGGAGMIGTAQAERQPHMHAALNSLKDARNHLNQASDDKGGHRAKALELTRDAIDQVEAGIRFDNQN